MGGVTFNWTLFVKEAFLILNRPMGWIGVIIFAVIAILIVRGPSSLKM
jgi:hypothetical protein